MHECLSTKNVGVKLQFKLFQENMCCLKPRISLAASVYFNMNEFHFAQISSGMVDMLLYVMTCISPW